MKFKTLSFFRPIKTFGYNQLQNPPISMIKYPLFLIAFNKLRTIFTRETFLPFRYDIKL